jgi:outer membrane lipoprotein SlyB
MNKKKSILLGFLLLFVSQQWAREADLSEKREVAQNNQYETKAQEEGSPCSRDSSTGERVAKGAVIGGAAGTGVGFLAGKTLPGLAIGAVTGGGLFGLFGGKKKKTKKCHHCDE